MPWPGHEVGCTSSSQGGLPGAGYSVHHYARTPRFPPRVPRSHGPAQIRRILVGIVSLGFIVLTQAVYVYGKVGEKAAVAAVREPVLPDHALATDGTGERCSLLVVSDRDPEHLFCPTPLRISDC